MARTFTPVYTEALNGANVNPLPTPWGVASLLDGATALQILGNKCTGVGPVPPGGAVSAMFLGRVHAPDYALISQPCYGQVTIASLSGFVSAETSIDIILCDLNPEKFQGYSFEISRNTEYGGYHFDCIGGYDAGNVTVFSGDFDTPAPKAGDVIICFIDGTTAGTYLNGTLMITGTLPAVPSGFDQAVFLQINCGTVIGDPSVSEFVVGTVSGS